MSPEDEQNYAAAEQALLHSEGVEAESQTVELDRLESTARVLIAGDGPPVLFVPGVMNSGAVFAGLVGRLPDYRCIMVERPGTALSPPLPNPPTDIDAHRRFGDALLVDILDGLHIDQSHVVCTSLGGWATFRSLAHHPDRFLRASALAYQIGARVTGGPLSMRTPAPKWMLPRRIRATPGIVRAMLKPAGMRNTIESGKFSDELTDWLVALFRYTETFRSESLYNPRPFGPFGQIPEVRHSAKLLAKVTAPVHLFWGTDDIFGDTESAQEFTDMLPNAELQLVDGAGHAPWLDEPELAADAVRQHLAG